jgi:hypothetical protein
LEKQSRNIRPIMIGEVICHLVAHILTTQFKDTFAEHFNCH